MPRITEFLGITIAMFYNEHAPPHFHVRYAEYRATICIDSPGLLTGDLPPCALGMVVDWKRKHKAELQRDWECWAAGVASGRERIVGARSPVMVDIVHVSVLADYRVHLRFDNGIERDVDLRPFLNGPAFEPLVRDRAEFERVHVDSGVGTIVWPNGADIDPDVLYEAALCVG